MQSLTISFKAISSEVVGGNTFISAYHYSDYTKGSFAFKIMVIGQAPIQDGSYYLATGFVPTNLKGADGLNHPTLTPIYGSKLHPSTPEAKVNSFMISGNAAGDSKFNSEYTVTNFGIYGSYWDGEAEQSYSLSCAYWRKFGSGLKQGNQYILEGSIEPNTNAGSTYFNMRVSSIGFGAVSKKNQAAAV